MSAQSSTWSNENSTTYLVSNGIWTTIDTSEYGEDDGRLMVTINSHVHEFPNRDGFTSFVSHFHEYRDAANL